MPATVEQWIKQQMQIDARHWATCVICGKTFVKRGNRLTCSRTCSRVRHGARQRVRYLTDPEVLAAQEAKAAGRAAAAAAGLARREAAAARRTEREAAARCQASASPSTGAPRTTSWPGYAICVICRKPFAQRSGKRACSQLCARVLRQKRYYDDPEFRARLNAAAQNRRADRLGAGEIRSPRALTLYLIERDHGICGICGEPVTDADGPLGPSIDHVIPLRPASGAPGEHSLGNLQLAHLRCNLRKGNRVSVRPGGNYNV